PRGTSPERENKHAEERPGQQRHSRRSSSFKMKPELYLRRFHVETRCVRCFRVHVIPLAGAVASLSAVKGQDEFALGNDANILGIVTVGRYDSAFGVRGKQDITVLRLQFERVERPVKWRKVTKQFRKMRHLSGPSTRRVQGARPRAPERSV